MNSSKMLSLMIAGSIVTVACGESKSSMNPVAPSAVVIGTHNDEAGDAGAESSATAGKPAKPGDGNGNGNGNDDGKDKEKDKDKGKDQPTVPTTPTPPGNVTPPTNTTPPAPITRKVEIEGLIAAKAGDSIVVNGQTVVVPATCPIRHGSKTFSLADLGVGDRVHVRASRTTSGVGVTATTTLEATEVKLQNPGGGNDDGEPVDPTALVSVTALNAHASEAANTGAFRLTRSGSAALLASPLTVTFELSGTAINGGDYQNTPVTATFLASQASVDVLVTPLADTTTEGAESVILTLTGVAPYDVGSPASATVTITDTDAPLVSVTAFDSTASETGPDLGTFRFSRTGSTASALTVTFTVTGTAISGTDYQSVPLTVTFNAGQSTADLVVVPSPDATVEGPETAVVTVTDGAAYDVGSPAMATITITG